MFSVRLWCLLTFQFVSNCFKQASVTLSAIDTDHVCLCGGAVTDGELKGAATNIQLFMTQDGCLINPPPLQGGGGIEITY